MKTKITLLLLFVAFMLSGCSNSSSTNIVAQEKCSKSAKDFFSSYMDKQGDYDKEYRKNSYNFTNHYDQKLNKCFVLITDDNQPYEFHKILYDIYENKEWGGVHTAGQIAGLCGVKIGDSYKTCEHVMKDNSALTSIEEFNNLVKQYMEE